MMLTDPFHNIHMGRTTEGVARRYNVSRKEQDEFAVEIDVTQPGDLHDAQCAPVCSTMDRPKASSWECTEERIRGEVAIRYLRSIVERLDVAKAGPHETRGLNPDQDGEVLARRSQYKPPDETADSASLDGEAKR